MDLEQMAFMLMGACKAAGVDMNSQTARVEVDGKTYPVTGIVLDSGFLLIETGEADDD